MARVYYVSQVVKDNSVDPPRTGAMHFTTPDGDKARAETAVDPDARHLFMFDDGVLFETDATRRAPEFLLNSARRKEAQRVKLEQQAADAEAQAIGV